MQRVNLIPKEERIYQRFEPKKTFVSVLFLTLVALGLIFLFQLLSIERCQTQLRKRSDLRNSLSNEKKNLEEALSNLNALLLVDERLKNKFTILQRLSSDRIHWSRILRQISLMIPSGLWLEGLSVTDEEIKNEKDEKISFKKIVLSGYSLEDSRIADFLINLENSSLLENPVLEFGQKELDGGKKIFNFDISAKLR